MDASRDLTNGESELVAPDESGRLAQVAGENARLTVELRQALARAQFAEAETARLRGSTKFQVGDLLVQAARHPRRLIALPRDLLRLYRLRRHRRTQPGSQEVTSPGRIRRSDLRNDSAARLLLPRLSERTDIPLSIAGAVDALTADHWRCCAAVTSVLPHDAAMLTAEADPDIVVIDTSSSAPLGTWSHLGNPAATDRAVAATEMIDAAKGNGRPVVLMRSDHDNPGLDAIAARCDLVVGLPGSAIDDAWIPGIDLGVVSRIRPHSLAGQSATPRPSGVSIHAFCYSRQDRQIEGAWRDMIDSSGRTQTLVDERAPEVSARLNAMMDSGVVALHARAGNRVVGAPSVALTALACGLALVSPEDSDLQAILDVPGDAREFGWFTYPAGDVAAAQTALDDAISFTGMAAPAQWQVWRSLFLRGSTPASWAEMTRRLELSVRPLAVRDVAVCVLDLAIDFDDIAKSLERQVLRPREVIVSHDQAQHVRQSLHRHGARDIAVIGIHVSGDSSANRSRAAQASSSHLLAEACVSLWADLPSHGLADAVAAFELTDGSPHARLTDPHGSLRIDVLARGAVLRGGLGSPAVVAHPGWQQ